MKKCTYCGKEYKGEETVCAIDGYPVVEVAPKPVNPSANSVPAEKQDSALPPIEILAISTILTAVGVLDIIGSALLGYIFGSETTTAEGLLVFVGGVISGLILIGFARVIQNTSESSQRLRRLEILIGNAKDKEKAA
jgi:hypothetical protein